MTLRAALLAVLDLLLVRPGPELVPLRVRVDERRPGGRRPH